MPYVVRTVVAGPIRETRKFYTGRVHTKGIKRAPVSGEGTGAAQQKVNDRQAEEKLRWKLNANFSPGDYHLVLHYYDTQQDLQKAEADKREFLRLLRKEFRKLGAVWKYVSCTETKRMTNIHHHIILPEVPPSILSKVWERVVGENGGNISIKPLDRRGNHAKLARYLMKESESTVRRWRELGKRYKRFTCAQGMIQPEPAYQEIPSAHWAPEPRPRKGWNLLKDDDGATVKNGVHEINGYPWQEYFEIWAGRGSPPDKPKKGNEL